MITNIFSSDSGFFIGEYMWEGSRTKRKGPTKSVQAGGRKFRHGGKYKNRGLLKSDGEARLNSPHLERTSFERLIYLRRLRNLIAKPISILGASPWSKYYMKYKRQIYDEHFEGDKRLAIKQGHIDLVTL